MKNVIFLFLVTVSTLGFGQETEHEEKFRVVQVQPNFKGGMGKFYKYISKNLEYPIEALENETEGKVFVEFIVDTTGAIIDESVKVVKGVNESLDKEAVRLLRESPDWQPGRLTPKGKAVKVRVILPIIFKKES